MTIKEAIDILVNATFSDEWQGNEDLTTAYHMAINALEHEQALGEAFNIAFLYGKEKGMEAIDKVLYQMGMDGIKEQEIEAIEQEPCEDCISRQEAIYVASGFCHPSNVAKELAKLPSVTPKPKTGHWIDDMRLGYHVSVCSNCNWRGHGDTCLIYKPKYCPNCGCHMVEPQESEGE